MNGCHPSAISAVISTLLGPIEAITIGMSGRATRFMNFNGLPSPVPVPAGNGSVTAVPSWVTLSPDQTLRQMSTVSRVRPSGLSNGTPCQPSMTCAPDVPMPSVKRPPDSASMVATLCTMSAGERE